MSEETILKAFEEQFISRDWEEDAHAWDINITNRPEEIVSFIRKALQAKEKEVREEIAREVEKKKLPIPNPYGNVFRVEKYNEVMDSLISIMNKK